MKYIFIRNDDVRGTLDKELIQLVDLNIKHNIPISLTVEPANVTKEVVDWLLEKKRDYPQLIELVQHGYDHGLKFENMVGGKLKKGEFGGDRTYEDQYADIKKGKEIMDKLFDDKWFPLFTFPFGARNKSTINAVNDAGFFAVNGSMGITKKHKLFYAIGRLLNKEVLKGRKISYNLRYKKGTKLFQIDTALGVIKKYHNDDIDADIYTLDELKQKTLAYLNETSNVGIVLHHRYHYTPEKMKLVDDYYSWINTLLNIECVTQETIYNTFK